MKKFDPNIDMMKKERREMFAKLTRFARKKVSYMVDVEGYTKTEIAQMAGVKNPRITEILGFEGGKYNTPISEDLFYKLIWGGILSVKEIKKQVQLTEKEYRFVEGYEIFENKAFIEAVAELSRTKGEQAAINAIRREIEKGKDKG